MPKKIQPKTFPQHLGAALNAAMTARGVGQEETAAAVGMNEQTLGRRIRGNFPLQVIELVRLCAYLKTSPARVIDDALASFGGIEKLLSEGRSTNNVTGYIGVDITSPVISITG